MRPFLPLLHPSVHFALPVSCILHPLYPGLLLSVCILHFSHFGKYAIRQRQISNSDPWSHSFSRNALVCDFGHHYPCRLFQLREAAGLLAFVHVPVSE